MFETKKKKVERMKSSLHLLDAPRRNKQIFLVDDQEKFDKFDPVERLDTVPELLDQTANRLRKSQLEKFDV